VCRRTGDPNKFTFCKRCDAAYHCYCQQPPHKNVSSGPYLCPKHTRCHSCGSNVPGNGLSVRWFLGYTCCDACGRLFVKGNYCPVCLKVYRDSESTPMVCCDVCQRWVHCQCDGISDEKYLQFQVDGNLQYVCATCRGDCYQVRDLEDAVQELWKRRDTADRDLIASLRAAAGLPTQEEIFSISPYSDDEETGPTLLKNDYGRSVKFSLKGSVDKSPKKSKVYGKKSSNKKYGKKTGHQASLISKTEAHQSFEGHGDAPSSGYSFGDNKNHEMQGQKIAKPEIFSSPIAGSLSEGICSINQAGVLKHKFIDEVTRNNENRSSRTGEIKSNKSHALEIGEDFGKHVSKSKTTKGPKLVIHIGARSKNATNSPMSDTSSCQREQELTTSNGDKMDYSDQVKGAKLKGREINLIKIKKVNSDGSVMTAKPADGFDSVSSANTRVMFGKRSTVGSTATAEPGTEVASRGEKISMLEYTKGKLDGSGDLNDDTIPIPPVSHTLPKDTKPLLKLKFKNPYNENQSSCIPGEDEKGFAKGLRSKRKRPPFIEKTTAKEDEDEDEDEDAPKWFENSMDEIMDANWILQKLGKDAIGKRVEVHQSSENSWHRGTVTDVVEGTTIVSVTLDNGRAKNLELGKQGIRFVSQKQRQ
ncbi:unnamed protein product, partial [Ilex paraguariensis]